MRRRLSIRTRLTIAILAITLGCLAVGFTVVGVRQVDAFKDQRAQTMSVIAEVVGNASVSALAFDDADDARDTLRQLSRFRDIQTAALYDDQGHLFATYQRQGTPEVHWQDRLPSDAKPVHEVKGDVSLVRSRIDYDGQFYGTIELAATNHALTSQIDSFVETLFAIGIALIVLSVTSAFLIQRRITRPIFELAAVAKQVSEGGDTSIRARKGYPSEIGVLATGFNAMLDQLGARERELVSSRDTMRALIDASPVAIIGIEKDGTVSLWNPRAAEIFQVFEEDAIGKPIAEVAADRALAKLWRTATTEAIGALEVALGDRRALTISTALLPGGGAVAMIGDITDRRRAEEALTERAAQLQRAQKMDVVGRLAGGVAHDFNNLLTVVLASCRMLDLRSAGRGELRGYIENIQNAAQRGSALSRRLLAFSRQNAVDARILDVRSVLGDLEKMVRSVMIENIDVRVEQVETPCAVLVDQGQLEQILLNMVLNARDAMPNGGVLTLRTRASDPGSAGAPESPAKPGPAGWAVISVADTGIGMSAETMARVFEPFFTTKANGTGLGLATAHQIAHDLGGEITVTSTAGKGTTFTLWLPRMASSELAAADVSTISPVSGSDTVLVVEDEPALRNLVQIMLAEAGYHVIAAANPQEALALGSAPGVEVDLLLTDVVMPGMSGPELAGELLRRCPEIQVLYMSGYIGDALTQHGVDETAAALVHKPFKPEHLLQVIRDMLDARPQRRTGRTPQHLFGRSPGGGSA
jgi:two-component system cell cycle sensor histidine kinase/response regulator CckA